MESSIKNHINCQLHGNVKLNQSPVESTTSCTLSRFTKLKSTISVDFGTLAQQSGNVVALHRGNVVAWQGGVVIACESGDMVQRKQHRVAGYTRTYTRGRAGSCELEQAGSCELGWSKLRTCKLRAASCEL